MLQWLIDSLSNAQLQRAWHCTDKTPCVAAGRKGGREFAQDLLSSTQYLARSAQVIYLKVPYLK